MAYSKMIPKGAPNIQNLQVKEGQITVNGIQLRYEIWGDGSHPIVCIPGQ